MVASISARGGVQAALGYYGHLGRDDYYLRGGEPPGRWAGEAAARLSLDDPVIRSEFEAALNGIDPKTGARLAALGGRHLNHAAGWDMTFSAPKSVSVAWALSDAGERLEIERAQRSAVAAATRHLEQTAGWARRGKGVALREPTAGLLLAKFDHHVSRELDPQLHTHVFVFNVAPRKDGTWGAIISRELYKAQKQAGAVYRAALAADLERQGYAITRSAESFRIAAVPRQVERAFSKRRLAIEAAAEAHGYRSAKGMELAALRTRQAKREVRHEALFDTWRAEARALKFEFKVDIDRQASATPPASRISAAERHPMPHASRAAALEPATQQLGNAADKLSNAARAVDQRSGMPGLAVDLRQHEREHGRR